jgi:tetratricopeptide (TPR) repeat protein
VLSEEALILAAVAGACVLLVLGVLELMWPTRPPHERRRRLEPAPARPVVAAAPPRPAQSILPRRLIDSPGPARPAGGFAFPPPPDYVPPPPPREETRPPVRPIGVVRPVAPVEEEAVPPLEPEPVAEPEPVEVAYIPPPPVEVEPPPIEAPPAPLAAEPLVTEPEPQPDEPQPPRALEPELPRVAPEPRRFDIRVVRLEPEPEALAPEPEPPLVEPEPPGRLEPEPLRVQLSAIEPATPAVVPPPPIEPQAPMVEPLPLPVTALPPPVEPLPPVPTPEPPPQPAEPPAPPKRRRRSKTSPHARPHRVLRPAPEGPGAARSAAMPVPSAPTEAPAEPLAAPTPPAGTEAKLTRDSPLVERCFALYQEKRFDEALSIAEEALAGLRPEASAGPSRETAALWSVVGLAKQALGDDEGAHTALESSVDAALDPERSTYRRHLATHALEAAQARLARAGSHDPVDRMAVIRTAIAWTERGLAAVPADPGLGDAREASHDALWQAYEQAATTLLQRQEFLSAREILHEALDDPKLPPARAAGFRGLLSGSFGGEIGQLTAQAILSMQEGRESEAVGVLQRAEELLAVIPADTLPPTRRDEVDQRLWWGYAELGSRRLDAGDYEEALDPLVHALRFTSIGAERQAETRAAVVRALEGIAAVRALSIRRLAEAGSRDEAIVAAGELNELVKRGLEIGITEDDLAAAFARVRRLCEELGMDSRA